MYAAILIIIFGICILLVGFYMFRGHKIDALFKRAPYQHLTKSGWRNVGKWTMVSSLIIIVIGVILLILRLD